jgi:hypothetical protein
MGRHWQAESLVLDKCYRTPASKQVQVKQNLTNDILHENGPDNNPRKNICILYPQVCA